MGSLSMASLPFKEEADRGEFGKTTTGLRGRNFTDDRSRHRLGPHPEIGIPESANTPEP
jgi:hypothetical protein